MRILYICHNHPGLHAGGTEIFAHALFSEMKRQPGVSALFVGCTNDIHRERKPGTVFQTIGRSADELLMWTGHFDRFFLSQTDLYSIVPEFGRLLTTFRPDVVHFHHTLLAGAELLALVKRLLPHSAVYLTLHDYYPICHNDGQMVTTAGRLCEGASPDACHRCFPELATDQFVLRRQYLRTLFSQVDRFIAPSQFLADRYVAWGLPTDRVTVMANGLPEATPVPHRTTESSGRRDRFGFFGHINRFKGAMVALDAARRLEAEGDVPFSLDLHGGADFQTGEFVSAFEASLAQTRSARWHGSYERADLPRLVGEIDWVVVPSVWWENAPLVIQEALQQRRPVITSDIGGMAEMIADGLNGLRFRVADPMSLAATMRRAAEEPGLWDRCVSAIQPVRTIAQAAAEHFALYMTPQAPRGVTAPDASPTGPASPKAPRRRRVTEGAAA